jgi:hypothetical protein
MDAGTFTLLQTELLWAFWPFAQWWIILFMVSGLLMAILIFFFDFVSRWLND